MNIKKNTSTIWNKNPNIKIKLKLKKRFVVYKKTKKTKKRNKKRGNEENYYPFFGWLFLFSTCVFRRTVNTNTHNTHTCTPFELTLYGKEPLQRISPIFCNKKSLRWKEGREREPELFSPCWPTHKHTHTHACLPGRGCCCFGGCLWCFL